MPRALAFRTPKRPSTAEDDRRSASPIERADFPADHKRSSRWSSSSVHFVLLLRAIGLNPSLGIGHKYSWQWMRSSIRSRRERRAWSKSSPQNIEPSEATSSLTASARRLQVLSPSARLSRARLWGIAHRRWPVGTKVIRSRWATRGVGWRRIPYARTSRWSMQPTLEQRIARRPEGNLLNPSTYGRFESA